MYLTTIEYHTVTMNILNGVLIVKVYDIGGEIVAIGECKLN